MADDRKPFIRFATMPVEDRNASEATGMAMYKDVDYIFIVPHGSEGKVELCEIYQDWVKKIKRQLGPIRAAGGDNGTPFVVESRFPREWLDVIEKQYELWKKGEELPVEGTALKQWAVLPPAMLQNMLSNHIYTIEQLANASDEAINPIGMGCRLFRNRAQDWVKMNVESEKNRISNEVNLLREDNAQLRGQVNHLMEQLTDLVKRIPPTETQRTMEQHVERVT